MIRIHLEDKGQDFLRFDYDEESDLPRMQNVQPFQQGIYEGSFILNAYELKEGAFVEHSKAPSQPIYRLKYKIVKMELLKSK